MIDLSSSQILCIALVVVLLALLGLIDKLRSKNKDN